MLYSPGGTARIAQPLRDVSSSCEVVAGAGPVAATSAARGGAPDAVPCASSAEPAGELMMPFSSTDLPAPISGEVTLEVVCRYSAFAVLEALQLLVPSLSTNLAVETIV